MNIHPPYTLLSKIIASIGLFFCSNLYSQDIHYSMYDLSPLNLNPANTGQFNGNYRFNGNHRNQWRSVTVPYSTFSLSADAKNIIAKQPISTGLQMNQDRTGDSRLNTFQANGSAAYALALNSDSTQLLSFGLQLGLTNRNLTYDPLQFDAQYNGFRYDGSLSNQESFNRNSHLYANVNTGLSYSHKVGTRKIIRGGIAVFNLTRPKQSVFNDPSVHLDMRYIISANAEWKVAEKVDLLPTFYFASQGKYKEVNIGINGRYVLLDFMGTYRALWGGMYYRNKDATYIAAGVEYDAWKLGLSYDINLSSLAPASNGRGAFEIALQYIINLNPPKRTWHRICPDYL